MPSILDRGLTAGGQFRLSPAILVPTAKTQKIRVLAFRATVIEPIKEVAIAVVSPIRRCTIEVTSIIAFAMPLPREIPKGTTVTFVVGVTFNLDPGVPPRATYLAQSINCHEGVYVATGNGIVFRDKVANSDGTFTCNWDVTIPGFATQGLKQTNFNSYFRLFFDDGRRFQPAKADVVITQGEPQTFSEIYDFAAIT